MRLARLWDERFWSDVTGCRNPEPAARRPASMALCGPLVVRAAIVPSLDLDHLGEEFKAEEHAAAEDHRALLSVPDVPGSPP